MLCLALKPYNKYGLLTGINLSKDPQIKIVKLVKRWVKLIQ